LSTAKNAKYANKDERIPMTRPLIGITARHAPTAQGLPAVQILRAYVTAIVGAGGAPILIPPDLPEDGWRTLFDRLDGILFSGGADIGLEYFDGEPHPTVEGHDRASAPARGGGR
jgi:putative glutamine amidotransferase